MEDISVLRWRVTELVYDFTHPAFQHVSDDAKTFITFLLTKDPACRINAAEALQSNWIKVSKHAMYIM